MAKDNFQVAIDALNIELTHAKEGYAYYKKQVERLIKALDSLPAEPPEGGQADEGKRGSKKGTAKIDPTKATIEKTLDESLSQLKQPVPFLSTTRAGQLLKQRLGVKGANVRAISGVDLTSGAAPAAILSSMQKITLWKCERIENRGEELCAAIEAVQELDSYRAWEKLVIREAAKKSISPIDIVREMSTEPSLAGIERKMDAIYLAHPKEIARLRDASAEFERNIENVIKEYANSEAKIQRRVTQALRTAMHKCGLLPSLGDTKGDYGPALAVRLDSLAVRIGEHERGLLERKAEKSPPK